MGFGTAWNLVADRPGLFLAILGIVGLLVFADWLRRRSNRSNGRAKPRDFPDARTAGAQVVRPAESPADPRPERTERTERTDQRPVRKEAIVQALEFFMGGTMYENLHEWSAQTLAEARATLLALGETDIALVYADAEPIRARIQETLKQGGDLEDHPALFDEMDQAMNVLYARLSALKAEDVLKQAYRQRDV